MNHEKRLDHLLDYLLGEHSGRTQASPPGDYATKRALLRKLVNIRPPRPISDDFIRVQDTFLQEEASEKGTVSVADIPQRPWDDRILLWQGDITRLKVDAIVNAANSKLLGCFVPCHSCIDNAIHTYAGVQLRGACHDLMQVQGHDEETGTTKITLAYNLPSRYVLHTVGPIVKGTVTQKHRDELASCYHSCFTLAKEHGLGSIAFCCISTGEFRFPKRAAAEIAVQTAREFLANDLQVKRVVFNVFRDDDYEIYHDLLGRNEHEI
ncbi:MAG: protein-ADP-ribose hydrolase [Desulfomonile tiedjei]|uniref:Protein-ADP-ribose hydrolase n=1 Tax=Desulfomonile tiedjei TaxID=2358 RepID=A0A9D6V4H3_9BACT|nr:protein-ADP-ribose hydrolase [Desulfomonile tiedjei]